jgi:hypothetical protein
MISEIVAFLLRNLDCTVLQAKALIMKTFTFFSMYNRYMKLKEEASASIHVNIEFGY